MCIGGFGKTPDVPTVPERQSIKQPVQATARDANSDDERRRRGMMATILTSAGGALTPVTTTANPATKLG
jgi:hypothetical protein